MFEGDQEARYVGYEFPQEEFAGDVAKELDRRFTGRELKGLRVYRVRWSGNYLGAATTLSKLRSPLMCQTHVYKTPALYWESPGPRYIQTTSGTTRRLPSPGSGGCRSGSGSSSASVTNGISERVTSSPRSKRSL